MSGSTDAWAQALDEKFRATGAASPVALVVQYDVVEATTTSTYHLVLGPGGDRAVAGPAPAPDATFRMTRATADDIRSGRRSAEAAFLSGELDLIGDASVLIEARRALLDA